MRIRRALEIAFYPRRAMILVLAAIGILTLYQTAFVDKYPLLNAISFTLGTLFFALAYKLLFSAMAGPRFGIIVGPYRDDIPGGTMFLLAIFSMLATLILIGPLMREFAARSGID